MRLLWRSVLSLVLLAAAAMSCRSDVNPDIVKRGKDATALVEIEGGKGFGTAFCIDPSGLFVTNDHVAEALGKDSKCPRCASEGEGSEGTTQAVSSKGLQCVRR